MRDRIISRCGGKDPLIFNLDILWGDWTISLPGRFSLGKRPHWSLMETGWSPGAGLDSLEQISLPPVGN